MAKGSPVTLRYDATLDRSIYTFDPEGPLQSGHAVATLLARLQLSFSDPSVAPVDLELCAGGCDPSRYLVVSPDGFDTFSGLVPLHVGDTISVSASLQATTFGGVFPGPAYTEVFGTGNAKIDSYHSAHPYFKIDGADAFLLADSGHDYTMMAMDLPEPESWQAIFLGLVGILVSSRRSSLRGKQALNGIRLEWFVSHHKEVSEVKKIAVLLGFVAIPALAQERAFLPKGEVEILAAGKKWVHVRIADQNKVSWALSNGGYFWGNNLTTGQADKGTWSVNEQGQLCVKWQGRSADRCVAVLKDGEKLKLVDSNDLNGTYADLTVE